MIRLRFNSLAGTDPRSWVPRRSSGLKAHCCNRGSDHTVVGRYFDHHWELAERFVSSYECVEAACLHFVGPSGATLRDVRPFPTGALSQRLMLCRS